MSYCYYSPLYLACKKGNIKVVKLLVKKGVKVDDMCLTVAVSVVILMWFIFTEIETTSRIKGYQTHF